jgi:hypothetical protein
MKGRIHWLRCAAIAMALWAFWFQPVLATQARSDTVQGKPILCVYNQTTLEMARNAEPLGPQRVLQLVARRRNDQHCKMNPDKPGLGAVTIATLLGEPDRAANYAYERGAKVDEIFLAPARRVNFFLWQDTLDQLRPDGLALFRSAVLWPVGVPK